LIDEGNMTGMFMFCKFCDKLEDALGIHVDVVMYEGLRASLINKAANDEVILYERA
jgi:predicted nucleotidyltransferase